MRLLVLGGTAFVGRAVVDDAVARGWDVTVLNRGRSGSGSLPDGVTQVVGDRTRPEGLAGLGEVDGPAGGVWDAVVDTWSWAPSAVRDSARLLADRAERYVYVSSRSVYDAPAAGAREDWPVVDGSPDDGPDVPYARLKRGAELAVAEAFEERATILRPGLVLGPREDVGRLPWWLTRVARGGPFVAPGPAEAPVQLVDARDLARFALDLVDPSRPTPAPPGPVDVVGPSGPVTTGRLLLVCVATTSDHRRRTGAPEATPRWVDPQVLLDAGVEPWTQLPVWLPPGEDHDALHRSDVTTALDLGLVVRPVEATVADTWSWLRALARDGDGTAPLRTDRPAVGLDPSREREVLAGL
ncbi:reductase [Paraoerskovia sediminicola]|uniref:Reductase n=1 Tax=Paraoerskovia sediminicola TaxID=1138587 RepID=A0ABM8G125_9CELL|nr:NAD-dependent epimerase/dehydratase family protein [Paraoerskovia sediminicola]BDZ41753.1 reductase [Paraoerskovia sediminicola]